MAKPQGGLTKWFKEDWRDVKTGKKCGRSGKDKKKRPYPACRPKAVAGRIVNQKHEKKLAHQKLSGLSRHQAEKEKQQERKNNVDTSNNNIMGTW